MDRRNVGSSRPCRVSIWSLLVVLSVAPWGSPARGETGGDSVTTIALSEIHAEDGRLWVDVKEYPADELFQDVGKAAGFEVRIDRSYAERRLSVRFNGVPLERAVSRLVRLLDTKNYRIAYADEGSVRRLEIFKAELSGSPGPSVARKPPARGVRQSRRAAGARSDTDLSRPVRRRAPVRRRLANPSDEVLEEEEWFEEFEEAPADTWEDEYVPEAAGDEEIPYLEPVGDVQTFR